MGTVQRALAGPAVLVWWVAPVARSRPRKLGGVARTWPGRYALNAIVASRFDSRLAASAIADTTMERTLMGVRSKVRFLVAPRPDTADPRGSRGTGWPRIEVRIPERAVDKGVGAAFTLHQAGDLY